MKQLNWKGIFFLLIIITAGCKSEVNESRVESLPYYDNPDFTPNWIEPNSSLLKNFHQISPFRLINQDGDTITEATFKDKIYITDFFFTICPGICPKMTKNMAVLQDEFLEDQDVLLLSHSVTPRQDSVSVLKNYAESKGVISQKWHLATGNIKDIYSLGRNDYFVEEDLGVLKDNNDFLHTENFVLIDKNRHIRGIYNGLNKASINQLIKDVNALKLEG